MVVSPVWLGLDEIALVNLATYYSFPNITLANNLFRYSPDNGRSWFVIDIAEGCYDIVDINDTIQQNGHYGKANEDYNITIAANPNTLRTIMNVDSEYQVDFGVDNSLKSVLGFTNKMHTGYSESELAVNILNINSILVNIDIISGSYVNGSTQSTDNILIISKCSTRV